MSSVWPGYDWLNMPLPLLNEYSRHMGTIRSQKKLAIAEATVLSSGNLPEQASKDAWDRLIKDASGGKQRTRGVKFKDKEQAKAMLGFIGVKFET